jgi:V8-like Glu-specific endopeptidase
VKKALRILGPLFAVALILAMVLVPDSGPSAVASTQLNPPVVDSPEEQLVSTGVSAPDWVWATRDWTAEEMAAAKPYPLQSPQVAPKIASPALPDASLSGNLQMVTFPGGMPEGEQVALSNNGENVLGLSDLLAPTGYAYPGPFTRYTYWGKVYKDWPAKTIGVLFFWQRGGSYRCSAASIGGYAIWTAGHCVHDGSGSPLGWSYNVVFVPGYDTGRARLGQWRGVALWTLTGWFNSGNLGYDMGGVVLLKYKRKLISQKVGWLGFAYTPDTNPYYAQYHWFEIGYPASYPFDGNKQVICASSYAYSDANFSPNPVGVGCDQTGGTSGGPWIWGYGSGFYVNGNMSYRYTNPDHPLEMFSPYFGDAAHGLWYQLVTSVP